MYKPVLPPEVLDTLTPAIEAIREDVVHGVSLVTGRRINRAGKAAARANGGGANYVGGFENIMASVFGPVLLAEIRATVTPVDRFDPIVQEYGNDAMRDDDSDDEQEECDTYSCCGRCPDCENCHGDGRGETRDIANGRYRYCRDCDHECDD